MDFVGERPVGRFKLVIFDILIFMLQVLYLALLDKLMALETSSKADKDGTNVQQDLEAEEAGVIRSQRPAVAENEADAAAAGETEQGIEMQSLLSGEPDGRDSEGPVISTGPGDEGDVIVLQRSDFGGVFLNTARNRSDSVSTGRLQVFLQRLEAIRARRAAEQAQV